MAKSVHIHLKPKSLCSIVVVAGGGGGTDVNNGNKIADILFLLSVIFGMIPATGTWVDGVPFDDGAGVYTSLPDGEIYKEWLDELGDSHEIRCTPAVCSPSFECRQTINFPNIPPWPPATAIHNV